MNGFPILAHIGGLASTVLLTRRRGGYRPNMDQYYRSAIRLLFLIVYGATKAQVPLNAEHDSVFSGATKLHALDFWVRYPDYLAEELITRHEATKNPADLQMATNILSSGEPELRHVPKVRYLFGAYERLDQPLAILKARDLVQPRSRKLPNNFDEYEYWCGPKSRAFLDDAVRTVPLLDWYRGRTFLVLEVAGIDGGEALKGRQKRQIEYLQAKYRTDIRMIADRVRARLSAIAGT
jgi:hypothetical protein